MKLPNFICFLSMLLAPATWAQTIPNPSFESNTFTVFPGYASGNGGSIAGWTISPATLIGLNPAGGSPFADNGATPNGANSAFIQSINNSNSTLSTTITGLTVGATYQVSFRANCRTIFATPNPTWSLNSGAFVAFTASPAVNANSVFSNPYYTNSGTFIATNTTAALALRNQTVADTSVLLDSFSISPVASSLVSNANDFGAGSLRLVVSNALAGSTITFAAGLSGKMILLKNGPIIVNKNLTIDASALAGGAIISGSNVTRIFYVTNNATVTLNSLTLTNGHVTADSGGAIYNFSNCTVTLTNCTLTGNTVNGGSTNYDNSGGAIFNAGRMTIGGCRLLGNAATGSPGIDGCLNCLTNNTRNGNGCPSADSCANQGGDAVAGGGSAAGGAIHNVGVMTVFQSLLSGNSATGGNGGDGGHGHYQGGGGQKGGDGRGGAIYNTGALTNIQNTLSNNVAGGGQGGKGGDADDYQQGAGGGNGGAGIGGGIYNAGINVLIQNTLSGNIVSGGGGGHGGNASTPNRLNGEAIGGPGGLGGVGMSGGIFNAGAMTLSQNTLSGNTAAGGTGGTGGAGYGGSITFFRTSANGAPAGAGFGGGIYNSNGAVLTLNQNTLSGNSAIGGPGGPGGEAWYDNNAVTTAGAGANGNNGTGGGIYNAGISVLNQNTLAANSTAGGLGGAGGINYQGSFPKVPTSTNTSGASGTGDGGGIYNVGSLTLTNTIVAGNSAPLTANLTGSATAVNSLTNGSAALATLGNYGGLTQTMPPLSGSPAIDNGNNSVTNFLVTDQRSLARKVGVKVDIGAVELQAGEVYTNVMVLNTADSGAGSLRQAVLDAPAGGVIYFAANLSGQTIQITSEIGLTKSTIIDAGSLTGGITIRGKADQGAAGNFRLFNVTGAGNLTLHNLTLAQGGGSGIVNGGAIYTESPVTLTGCTLVGNAAGNNGGAIFNYTTAAKLSLTHCTLTANTCAAAFGGAVCNDSGSVAVMHCTITGNLALAAGNGAGGGIFNYSGASTATLTVTNSIVAGNTSTTGGADIHNSGMLTFGGANLVQSINSASTGTTPIAAAPLLAALGNYGGPTPTMPPLPGSPAINADAATSFSTDQRGLPRPVGAADIGAVELQAGEAYYFIVLNNGDSAPGSLRQVVSNAPVGATIRFTNTLSGQTIVLTNGDSNVNQRFAEIALNKDLTIDGSTLANSIQISGGGYSRVFSIGGGVTVTLKSLGIVNGYLPSGVGSGILNSGTLTLNHVSVAGNYNYGSGGAGIYNSGTLTTSNSTVTGNTSFGTIGGGIANAGSTTLINSTVANNVSSASGGGIWNNGTVNLNNSTIAGNSSSGGSGGIQNDGGTVTLNNTTVANNSGMTGGGIQNLATLKLTNSIVSANTASLVSNNIYGSYSGASNLVTATSINLAALGNYGGPTMTMPPLLGSPAIDTGSDSVTNFFTSDQRGYVRKVGTHVDIGAVEGVLSSGGPAKLINVTRLGNGSLRFGFTNFSGTTYTVFASTNLVLPVSAWSNLGPATETPVASGQFQFTDLQATNFPRRFYRAGSP